MRRRGLVKISEDTWNLLQKHLGYNDEEMSKFRENSRNQDIMLKAPGLMNKTIVAEVVDSHGCNSQHKVGDKFYFDGAGNLLTKLSPKRICIYAVNVLAMGIFALNELFYAGANPNQMRFKRAGCFDVGVKCGGWGHIVMEIRMEERKRSPQRV